MYGNEYMMRRAEALEAYADMMEAEEIEAQWQEVDDAMIEDECNS